MKLYVIIITFNGSKWIRDCIKSVLNSSIPIHLVVVDNNSHDDTISIIEKFFPQVLLIKQFQNLGFGKANNIGIEHAINNGADYVFLLNQDAYLEKDTLERLWSASIRNPGYGILSPLHYNWSGTALEYYFEKFLRKNPLFGLEDNLNDSTNQVYEVPFVNAAAWLIPRKTIMKIGGFDPIFYHYGEDNNYCQRLLYHDLKIGIVSNVKIYHDSKKRSLISMKQFSKPYYADEIKKIQVRYANPMVTFGLKERNIVRIQHFKIVIANIYTLNFGNIYGYLQRWFLFERVFLSIKRSRRINKKCNPNYINVS